MPVPNHDDKFGADPIVTPDQSDADPPPPGIVITYSRDLYEHLTDTNDGDPIDRYYGDLYTISDRVAVLGNFGIGAPTTAMLMEALIADGATTFLSIGYAGTLDDTLDIGDTVLCEKALRDDGTSHHYLEPTRYTHPSPPLFTHLETTLDTTDSTHHVGPTWTIDAIYQETAAEVQAYTDDGIRTVEMEAAAVFAVGTHHDVDTAAMFTISDYLTPEAWDPHFDAATDHLHRLGDLAIDALESYIDNRGDNA